MMQADEFQQGQLPEDQSLRPSWAAYFGAASGLVLGAAVGILGAGIVDLFFPGTDYAQMFWEILGPLASIVGFIVVGMAFHRWFLGQILTPAIIFFAVFFLGAYLAYEAYGLGCLHGP